MKMESIFNIYNQTKMEGDIPMTFGNLEYYLIGVNLVGFLYYLIYLSFLIKNDSNIFTNLSAIISLLGGSLGMLIAIIIRKQKAQKETMTSRIFILCTLVIYVLLYIIFKSGMFKDFSFSFWNLFAHNHALIIFIIAINIITFITFGIDKLLAIKNRSRIPIVTLLGMSLIGGTIGGLLAMYLFRHKTKKDYFTIGLPLIGVMQIVITLFLYNLLIV